MAVLRQIDALRDGEIDLGIVRLPVHDDIIETQFVHNEPIIMPTCQRYAGWPDSRPMSRTRPE